MIAKSEAAPIDPITMDGSSPELLAVMRMVQQVFDARARQREINEYKMQSTMKK